jgi:large subunit ribosomal protein L19e
MKFKTQKRISAQLMKCGIHRVAFDVERLSEIKEAITKIDIRSLIKQKVIKKLPEKGTSKIRHRKTLIQKRKGRQKGPGSKKGKKTARLPRKKAWMNKIRSQRDLLANLKDKKVVSTKVYRSLYSKATGGFFRSRRHIKLYIEEQKLQNVKSK